MILTADEFLQMALKTYKKSKKELKKQEKAAYKKYRKSLTPISKDEFMERLVKVMARYSKLLMFYKKNSFVYLDSSLNKFYKIISSIKTAKTGIDYAEIIDKSESLLDDWETVMKAIKQYMKIHKNEEIMEHIEQLKKERAERKHVLQFPKER